jgi:glutamate/tyrosine decarboxylase-like PLP-dependent enzyme
MSKKAPGPGAKDQGSRPARMGLPAQGKPADEVLAAMRAARERDARWHEGRAWSLVFFADDELSQFLTEAYILFFSENGLNPMAFPSLKKFEAEVVAMTAGLLGGDEATAGNMTSGGTESLLLAVLAAREWGRAHDPPILEPEMILPISAHPAFDKAAHYFDVKVVRTPVDDRFRADVTAVRHAMTRNTVLIVGSAPSYPHGVVDPIAGLAQVAAERGILCHVDACVGGMMLPFVRRLGYPVPAFDLSIPGVTSISVDLHKYGYSAKGASVILYKDPALRRRQFFATADWPGGIYASPTMAGTRPGGPIAAAWAIMTRLGEDGYLALADTTMRAATRLREGITAIDGLKIIGDPTMSLLAIGSDTLNVYEVGDEMSLRGWHLDRQQSPPSLHLTVTAGHAPHVETFLADLAQAAARARRPNWNKVANSVQVRLAQAAARVLPAHWMSGLTARASAAASAGEGGRSAAMYGLIGTLPNRGDVHELVLDMLEQLTRPGTPVGEP